MSHMKLVISTFAKKGLGGIFFYIFLVLLGFLVTCFGCTGWQVATTYFVGAFDLRCDIV